MILLLLTVPYKFSFPFIHLETSLITAAAALAFVVSILPSESHCIYGHHLYLLLGSMRLALDFT